LKCSLWEANRVGEWEKKRGTLEKSLVWAKGRFGRLHCARNMKIELGRMGRVISLSREPRISRTKGWFSFTDFSIPRWTTSSSVRLHRHKLYLGRYFQAVHVAAIFISKRYTARDVHSVYPNNIARKSRRCLFHVMGIISLPSFLLPPRNCAKTIRSQTRENFVEELGPWN